MCVRRRKTNPQEPSEISHPLTVDACAVSLSTSEERLCRCAIARSARDGTNSANVSGNDVTFASVAGESSLYASIVKSRIIRPILAIFNFLNRGANGRASPNVHFISMSVIPQERQPESIGGPFRERRGFGLSKCTYVYSSKIGSSAFPKSPSIEAHFDQSTRNCSVIIMRYTDSFVKLFPLPNLMLQPKWRTMHIQ